MDSLLKSDIFFMVTTACVVLISGLIGWALVYVLRILRNVTRLADTVSEEGQHMVHDVGVLREDVKGNLHKLPVVGTLFKKKTPSHVKHTDMV